MFHDRASRLCRIYPVRPLDCMLFPLDVVESHGRYYLIAHTELCPVDQRRLSSFTEHAEAHLVPRLYAWLGEYATRDTSHLRAGWRILKALDIQG